MKRASCSMHRRYGKRRGLVYVQLVADEPLLIAHCADLHFGRRAGETTFKGENQRELDIYRAGATCAEYLAELGPDLVVVAGDVWDHERPSALAIRHGVDFHRILREADIPVVVIGGNHDTMAALGRPTPLQLLARYFDCHVALEQQQLELCGINLCLIPYRAISTRSLEPITFSEQLPNLLVAHCSADTSELPPELVKYDPTKLERSTLFDPRFSASLLGHVHIHRHFGERAYYPGPLERLKWDEITNEPAIFLHRLHPDGTVSSESVRVADMGEEGVPRPAVVLQLDCKELASVHIPEAALELLESSQLEEALVQLSLTDAPLDLYEHLYEEVLAKRAKQRGAFDFRLQVKLVEEQAPQHDQVEYSAVDPAPGASLSEAFREFARAHDAEDLADLGAQLIAATAAQGGS